MLWCKADFIIYHHVVDVLIGSESKNWRTGGTRSVSPDPRGGPDVGRRGGRRGGRGRGRYAGINAGPRFTSIYQPAFGRLILQFI